MMTKMERCETENTSEEGRKVRVDDDEDGDPGLRNRLPQLPWQGDQRHFRGPKSRETKNSRKGQNLRDICDFGFLWWVD